MKKSLQELENGSIIISMSNFINIGFGNIVNADKIAAIVSPDAAPIKRLVQHAKDENTAVDATCGRKTRAVLVMDDGHVVLAAILPETVAARVQGTAQQVPHIVV